MKKLFAFLTGLTLLFVACKNAPKQTDSNAVAVTDSSWALLPFIKIDSANPVLGPGTGKFICPIRHQSVNWEEKDVFNPAIVVKDGKMFMLYRAEDSIGKYAGTSRIGLAISTDGIHFTRQPTPVLYPGNDAQKKI